QVSSATARPEFRWRELADGRPGSVLEVQGGVLDADVDIAETVVRMCWQHGRKLTLPVGFCADLEACSAKRRKNRDTLELTLPLASELPAPGPLLSAALQGPDGLGSVDGFMAGRDADAVRQHLLDLWAAGTYIPGEVEGKSQTAAKARSDSYRYFETSDPIIEGFTRRLDKVVLQLVREVPSLQGLKLLRGSPM
ncbi:unnamed protein product, partial [Polarella glacialis]